MIRLSCCVLVICLIPAGCSRRTPAQPVVHLTIATFEVGGIYHLLGRVLGEFYTSHVPNVVVSTHPTAGSVYNVDALQRGEADMAFALGDVAYFLYKRGTGADPRPHTNLRAIAVLYEGALQIIARGDSRIRSVADFRGKRVSSGSVGSGTELAARIVIEEYGLDTRDVTILSLPTDEVVEGMRHGTVDAGFVISNYPYPTIATADTSLGVRLVPISREMTQRIRSHYPFFRPTVIPAGTYRHQPESIVTIGVDNLLLCRADLSQELVFRLTKELFAALPELARAHGAAKNIDPDRASATPIPLHPGAARYYREREILQ